MKRSSNLLQTVSSTNVQTIHGQLCPAACQVIPEWIRNPARKGLLLPNPLAAMPGAHQSAALFHAMRLTSEMRSLQSP